MAFASAKDSEAMNAWRPQQTERMGPGSIIGSGVPQPRERCVQDALSELHDNIGSTLNVAAALVDRLTPITRCAVETGGKKEPAPPSSGVMLVAELDSANSRVQELKLMLENQLTRTML